MSNEMPICIVGPGLDDVVRSRSFGVRIVGLLDVPRSSRALGTRILGDTR